MGLVPWLALLDGAATVRAAIGVTLPVCVAYNLAVFRWFPPAIGDYAGVSPAWPFVALTLGAPLLQPQFLGLAVIRTLARGHRAATALAGASAWVATEWLVPKVFGDTLGHAFYASPLLRQAADLAGVAGLTLVLVVANECVLAAFRARAGRRPRAALAPAATLTVLVLALAVYGAVRLRQLAAPAGPPVTAAVVQGDLAYYDRLAAERGRWEAVREILDVYLALSTSALAAGGIDLLVWPETVYPTTFGTPKSDAGAAFDREIAGLVAGTGVPLLFGTYDTEKGREFNAAVVLERPPGGGLTFDAYRKASLFPLTERVPALLDSAWLRRRLPWLGSWTPGPGGEALGVRLPDGRPLRVGPLICYDAVDPRLAWRAVRAGAEVLVTISNDAWFADGAGAWLHLVSSAFRSIETRRPQLRATSTGISAVIDATGEVVALAGVHERRVLAARVTPEGRATTPVLHLGDWLGPVALLVGLGLAARRLRAG